MIELKPGLRLCSAVCSTEIVIIATPAGALDVRCGGVPMHADGQGPSDSPALDAAAAEGAELGKRYSNEAGDLELLCVKPGEGSLAVGDSALFIKGAKPLPASD